MKKLVAVLMVLVAGTQLNANWRWKFKSLKYNTEWALSTVVKPAIKTACSYPISPKECHTYARGKDARSFEMASGDYVRENKTQGYMEEGYAYMYDQKAAVEIGTKNSKPSYRELNENAEHNKNAKITEAYLKDAADNWLAVDVEKLQTMRNEGETLSSVIKRAFVDESITPSKRKPMNELLCFLKTVNFGEREEGKVYTGRAAIEAWVPKWFYIANGTIWLGAITALIAGGVYAWKKLKENGEDSDINEDDIDEESVDNEVE